MLNFLKVISIVVISFTIVSAVYLSSAPSSQVSADALEDRLQELTEAEDESQFLDAVVQIATILAVMALILLSAYGGFVMLTSQGNPEKLNEAREIIVNAVIGFAFIALSVAILVIIQSLLDLPLD